MGKFLRTRLSAFLGVYFFGWLLFASFIPIYFTEVAGLSSSQVGMIFALNAAACMLTHPVYGIVSDRLGQRKTLLYFIALGMLMVGPFVVLVYAPLLDNHFLAGAVLGAVFFALFFNAGVAAIESYTEKCSRKYAFEYGRVRMWGSIGAALGIFVAGQVFNLNPHGIFWLSSLTAVLLLFILYTLPQAGGLQPVRRCRWTDGLKLFRLGKVWIFMLFIVGSSCVYSVFDQQFGIYYVSLFPTKAEGNEAFGLINSLQVFVEAACLGMAPKLVNRIGARGGLLMAASLMAVRILGSALCTDTILISLLKLLHAGVVGVLLVSVFKYIAAYFDTRFASVMYLVGFELASQLGASLLSVVAGHLYDRIGFNHAYLLMGGVVALCIVFGACALQGKRSETGNGCVSC